MEQALHSNPIPDAGSAAMQPAWTSAIERHRSGDTEGAIVLYQRHLKRNPQDAPGWMNLGAALRRTGRADAALVCYQRALRLRPDDAAVWSNLGNLWKQFEEHEQSLYCHRRALQLDPQRMQLQLNCAVSLREAGRFTAAEDIIEQCLAREPQRPDLLYERALLRLHTGRYREAWPDYEARLLSAVPRLPRVDAPRWQGECIGGKRLLLQAEPGPGRYPVGGALRRDARAPWRGYHAALRARASSGARRHAGAPGADARYRGAGCRGGFPLPAAQPARPRGSARHHDPGARRHRGAGGFARDHAPAHRALRREFSHRRGVVGQGKGARRCARFAATGAAHAARGAARRAGVFVAEGAGRRRAAQRGRGGIRRGSGCAVPPFRRHGGRAGADGPGGCLRQRGGATRRLHGQAGARAAGVQPALDLRHARRFHAVVSDDATAAAEIARRLE
ncbi:MAG: tetratricopeptide repeat protein [Gammaproteobacteria bacterium]|nr:tetratricopeptide repeat protein [Gammaproteobacteria bacterium]